MQLTGHITPESLMSLEAYSKYRKARKAEIIAHRKLRSIGLGDHIVFNHDLDCRLAVEADAVTLCGLHSLKESHGNKA